MRVDAIGVKRMSGNSKESGKPFDFAQLTILKPIEMVASEKFQLQGYGFEISDLEVDKESVTKFAKVKFPCALELQLDTVPGRSGFRTIITGFKEAA